MFPTRPKLLMTVILLLGVTSLMVSQNVNEQVEKQQRALFIFNSSQQVIWPSLKRIDTFKIGVMGRDPITADIAQMARQRSIYNKPVVVKRINSIDQIDDEHIIYVNRKYLFGIKSILDALSKQTLLISEGYDFKSSMINMVRTQDAFEYEINTDLFKDARLKYTSSLEESAIDSFERWKTLYQQSEEKLNKIEEENEVQKEIIELQQKEIATKENVISAKNYSIENLTESSKTKDKQLRERIAFAKELEISIDSQLTQIEIYKEDINNGKAEIENQKNILALQNEDIAEKQKILNEKTIVISNQRKSNIILLSLLGLIFLASLLIGRGYINNKKLNKRLAVQHLAITKQSNLLESKNKELEQFAYIASHDLQEPLNTISSFIDLIKADYQEKFDNYGKESLGFIKEASTRMKNLIDGLLQYSRLGRGSDYKMVDCNEITADVQADLKASIADNNAQIFVENLPKIKGSEVELRALFQNLISNSIKFKKTETNPIIKINCNRDSNEEGKLSDFWEFSLADNGIGIPSEHQDRIFGIFQRLHNREVYSGSGIGLAHCKKIVESHGGEIRLTSEEGVGTTFYFTIPVALV